MKTEHIKKIKVTCTLSNEAKEVLECLETETGLTKSKIIELTLKEVDVDEVKKGLLIKKRNKSFKNFLTKINKYIENTFEIK